MAEDQPLTPASAAPAVAPAQPAQPPAPVPAAGEVAGYDPARWMYERIVRSIDAFEQGLSPDEEVGARLVATPGEEVFHVEHVAYWSPDLIMFEGLSRAGRRVQLIQHFSQLNLLLTSLPKEKPSEPPRRIGFDLVRKYEEEWGDPQA
jgi:hypothetical protein